MLPSAHTLVIKGKQGHTHVLIYTCMESCTNMCMHVHSHNVSCTVAVTRQEQMCEHKQPGTQVSAQGEPTKRGAILDIVLTATGAGGTVKLKGSQGCSDSEMVELRILSTARRKHNRLAALDFWRADFVLLRHLSSW